MKKKDKHFHIVLLGKQPKQEKLSAVTRESVWRIYPTRKGRKIALRYAVKTGYRYIVGWLDTQGYGLECEWRASWQGENCAPHIDMSDR